MEENTEVKDEREKRIQDLDADYQRHKENEAAFLNQLRQLQISLAEENAIVKKSVDEVLDSLPDMSSKGLIDKVLQLKTGKRKQLTDNIQKLAIGAEREKGKAGKVAAERDRIKNEIEQERIDGLTKDVFAKFREWVDLYQKAEDFFYNELVESISEGYLADPLFHMRADRLGLSATIKVSIDSHFKNGYLDHLNQFQIVDALVDLGDSYGERFFEKIYARQQDIPLVRETFLTQGE